MLDSFHTLIDNGWNITIHASDHAILGDHISIRREDKRYDAIGDFVECLNMLLSLTFWHNKGYDLPPSESTWTADRGWYT